MSDDAAPVVPARIFPELSERNRMFWTGGADGRLRITRCMRCAVWVSRPAEDCPDCGGAFEARPVSGRGTVYTYTINHQPFNPAVPVPYVIALVELVEGPGLRIATNIVDCEPDSVHMGLAVEVRFERHETNDGVVYAPVFVPGSGTAKPERRDLDCVDETHANVHGMAPP
jgi:uncharacterized OB-fold protein